MAEWLHEAGIGEDRAIQVEDGRIVEAAIELPGTLRAGTVSPARLTRILIPRRRGIVTLDDGHEAMIEPLPAATTEGATLLVQIVREAIPEAGRAKLPKAIVALSSTCAGPTLARRTGATELTSVGPDRFEQAGWSELLEEAQTGEIAFDGGALRMSVTPAMTLFDVDGAIDPVALAVAGAAAAARAIRRLGIAGSIGVDLPTLPARDDRQAAAAAIDAILPQPFERTAVNGFGFIQIVRRRERASIPELLQADPAGAAARALLRLAERSPGAGPRTLVAAIPVIARIEANPDWAEELARRIGAPVGLQAEPGLAISAGHVHVRHQG